MSNDLSLIDRLENTIGTGVAADELANLAGGGPLAEFAAAGVGATAGMLGGFNGETADVVKTGLEAAFIGRTLGGMNKTEAVVDGLFASAAREFGMGKAASFVVGALAEKIFSTFVEDKKAPTEAPKENEPSKPLFEGLGQKLFGPAFP